MEHNFLFFNRFYIHVDEHNDIFSFIETKNPLIIAGINNRIEIIKLLLKEKERKNPYLDLIGDLLDISIKYCINFRISDFLYNNLYLRAK